MGGTAKPPRNGAGKTRAPARDPAPAKLPGREPLKPALPKRFYKSVTVEERGPDVRVLLDGRRIRTPGKRELVLPARAFAEAVAREWSEQGARIDPGTMPLTRLANTVLDGLDDHAVEVRADIVAFAGSDLVCYRAAGPEGLVACQAAAWDPVLAWARRDLGADMVTATGVMPIEQRAAALARIADAIEGFHDFRLAALHILTTLTGSALLALAHAKGWMSVEAAWAAAQVDEDWQIEHWGTDAEAAARRERRWREFRSASRVLDLTA